MRLCTKEDFERVNSGMLYDMQVMTLGSMEAMACPDLSEIQLMGNMMLPMYELVQFYMTECDGDNCVDGPEKETFLSEFHTYLFMVNSQIDFSKYGMDNKPIDSTCKMVAFFTPYEVWTIQSNLYIMVN